MNRWIDLALVLLIELKIMEQKLLNVFNLFTIHPD